VRKDIISAIDEVIGAISKKDYIRISEISNHTIHDASIFQDDDSLTLAVLLYALSKVMQACIVAQEECPLVAPSLIKAKEALLEDDENSYRTETKNILRKIVKEDSQLKFYIQDVINRAKIKKASKMHEHGISIARTAELLGISQWELQTYIGKLTGRSFDGGSTLQRLKKARELFS